MLTCLTGTGTTNCAAGANASVTASNATTASNAATLASPSLQVAPESDVGGLYGWISTRSQRRAARVGAKLRCSAPKRGRCQGTVTVRAARHGAVLARATFDLRPRGHGTVKLYPGASLPHGSVLLTITTRQPNGRGIVTDQRNVTLDH